MGIRVVPSPLAASLPFSQLPLCSLTAPLLTVISEALVKSDREFIVLGLNLLFLLSQNRIAEFHTELEVISQEGLSNYYIKHPIELEQHVMEGSYNKVRGSSILILILILRTPFINLSSHRNWT